MTAKEVSELIDFLKAVYPTYYKSITDEQMEKHLAAWTVVFKPFDARDMFAGARAYISANTTGFPPDPGSIVAYANKVRNPADDGSGIEAWNLVRRAVNSPRDQYQAAFDVLPDTVKKIVGSPATLMAWGNVEEAEFDTVIQSNFLRSYEALVQKQNVERRIPDSLKIALSKPEPKRLAQPKSVEYDDVFDSTEVEMPKAVADRLAALRAKLGQ